MQRRRKPVAAIDVGSTKVAVIVGDLGERGEMRVLGFGVAPGSGLSRGVIDNIQSARDAVATAVAKAEASCGMRILSAVVGISGSHIEAQNNRGIVTIPDRARPISVEDRARVLDIAGEISIPTNRQVLHVLPRGYWVEGTELVSDPVGMYGNRLDAETHIISGSVSAIQNLTKCVEGAGVQVDEITLEPLASATAVLAYQERQQGVAVVDIGGSTTSIVVYDEGAVAHTANLPIAGSHFTHDLARMLRCPWESAEAAKCEYGSAFAGEPTDECVEIQAFGTQAVKQVSLSHICEILQARAEEVLDMVAMELRKVRLYERVAAGLVLTGGGSQLKGLAEVAEAHLRLPARVGRPKGFSGMSDLIGTPAFATSIGLVEYALREDDGQYESAPGGFDVSAGSLFKRIASMGRALMPQ
jgi:cell division protein FtsA